MKNIYKLLLVFLGFSMSLGLVAQDGEKPRVYVNPGHGGWGPNDRNMATINYPASKYAKGDTLNFFETNTNLLKGLALRDELEKTGKFDVRISRTLNGIVTESPNPNEIIAPPGQLVSLSEIAQDVESNNMDYFISIHSNAATEGAHTNFPLLLYRGTDDVVGNGLVEAKNMSLDGWKYIVDNGVTFYSHYTLPNQNNVRGDISFMKDSWTNVNGYTGYYGVLMHGCDGFLSEGCFHTYQPERQRLMNNDYCRQEGMRYSRAIRAWFGDDSETKGAIMGTVKDSIRSLEHQLYSYKPKSIDAFLPLNGVTVILEKITGEKVGEYTTDNEYNGLYVFTELDPGKYKIVYDFSGTEYLPLTKEIEVFANKTSFANHKAYDGTLPPPYTFLDPYYPCPDQSGDIVLENSYEFVKEFQLLDMPVLKDMTVRRTILRDNKLYVLAVDATKAPRLMVLNPGTGELIKEMSTEGVETNGFNGKELPYILSDIAFTTDGVLIGANSTVFGAPGNAHITGDFCIYKWEAPVGGTLEDAKPQIINRTMANTGADIALVGNNLSNFVANTIAVKGNADDFYIFFDSHAGSGWDWTGWGLNWVAWRFVDGVRDATKVNSYGTSAGGPVVKNIGENFRITYSPFGDINNEDDDADLYRFVLDGDKVDPIELKIDWSPSGAIGKTKLSVDVPVESSGASFFCYLERKFMAVPICEKQDDGKYSYRIGLYDVTDGFDQAKNIGITEATITDQATVAYMAGASVVDNADIYLYLMVGNNLVKYKSKEVAVEKQARILATDLLLTKTETAYDISYVLNTNATSAELILTNVENEDDTLIIPVSGLAKGKNTVSISFGDIPADTEYTWSVKASADKVRGLVKLSEYPFFGPKGVAIDKSPESKQFGRVYVTNSDAGTAGERATTKGVYILGADGSDITNQGDNAYAGNIPWAATLGESPRKVAVAADGRVFVSDHSKTNSGIYYMNPETFEMKSLFPDAVRETAYGNLTIGDQFVIGRTPAIGVRGEGVNTQIYVVDASSEKGNAGWKKYVAVYTIGEATTWNKGPEVQYRNGSYIANENTSVVPVEGGFWGAQFRGAGSNSTANPCFYYHSDKANKPVFNAADDLKLAAGSQNGGLAVNEKENLVVLSYDGGATIYSYTMNEEGVPLVTEKLASKLESSGVSYDDFEFDYAGNLYAVSYSGKLVTVWGVPTSDNTCITPAQKSMTIKDGILVSIEEETKDVSVKVTPTLIESGAIVEFEDGINTLIVFDTAGAVKKQVSGINETSLDLDFSVMSPGVYFIKVNNEKTVKVIKR